MGKGDGELAAFFARHAAALSEAFVVVLADHGHRFDAIRASLTGRLEERLPLFALSVPASLRDPALLRTLEENALRLTSHFDLYATLVDILRRARGEAPLPGHKGDRGLSLLRPIPTHRSCSEAGIPADYCVCQVERPLNASTEPVPAAAALILASLNERLAQGVPGSCAVLTLARVVSAAVVLPNAAVVAGPGWSWPWASGSGGLVATLRVSVEARPSGALLEALVRADEAGGLSLTGDVSRLNRYGNQSACIKDFTLRKFCYCATTSNAPGPRQGTDLAPTI